MYKTPSDYWKMYFASLTFSTRYSNMHWYIIIIIIWEIKMKYIYGCNIVHPWFTQAIVSWYDMPNIGTNDQSRISTRELLLVMFANVNFLLMMFANLINKWWPTMPMPSSLTIHIIECWYLMFANVFLPWYRVHDGCMQFQASQIAILNSV